MAREYLELIKLARGLEGNPRGLPAVRVAVLGDHATQQLTKILQAILDDLGLYAEIYEAEFDNIPVEILDPSSGLHRFAPEYVWLCFSGQQYRRRLFNAAPDRQAALPRLWASEVAGLVEVLVRCDCRVVVNNLTLPRERLFGDAGSASASALEANRELRAMLPLSPRCRINDIAFLAASVGLEHWYDDRLWIHSKYPCAPRHFPALAEGCARMIEAARRPAIQCLVLELDDTLWGGSLAGEGLEGIEIGGLGVGEACENFQRYLLQLKQCGLRLAVCSRSDEAQARRAFREHPGMVLRENDFAAFIASAESKSDHLHRLAALLNLGLETLVFVDAKSAGRDEIRRALPAAQVPELSPDPAEYIAALEASGLWEPLAGAGPRHGAETAPEDWGARVTNLDDYLRSLEMKMSCRPFDALHLQHIVQLLQHSNQFNLRTQNYPEERCREFIAAPERFPCWHFRLRDKFGDHGLMSVVCGVFLGSQLEIREWVMSCRVLNRGVEERILGCLARAARESGLTQLRGEYLPTAKNRMVSQLYARLGFQLEEESASGSRWTLDLATFAPAPTHIALDS